MPDYDFQSLSSYDFEVLSRALLQEEFGVRLESFARGPDGGIDFRFRSPDGDLVVQCKHYRDYDDLYRVLKRDEKPKVRRLEPTRYVLSVSSPLTPTRKDAILALFAPYCKSPSDIFGRADINNLLGLHPEIERNHFKLWLTSENVLRRILDGGIWGDTELTIQRIRQRARRYVQNASFPRARKVLEDHHYCIIAGIPGIGKTTLAEIILIDYVDRHGFEAIRIANDLSEIKGVKNSRRRQIFYFDDFLGTTALDKLQKNEAQRMMEFLEEVAENPKWRFLLTTREYILNTALIRYEAMAYPPVDLKPCIIELSDYTRPIRATILYNHIFFSDLPDAHRRALLESHRYETILSHRNYSPRLVEQMTQARNVIDISPSVYFDDFVKNLDNPTRIWNHAFRNQLTEAAQHLLLTMGSLPDEVLLTDLEIAFNSFYQYRHAKLGFSTSSRDFEHALKQLDGNFIKTNALGDTRIVTFHNPSVQDFLESYLAGSPNDVAALIDSACFFDQFVRLWQGRGEKRFSGVDKYSREFVQALSRQFYAPTCRIIRVSDGRGTIVSARRYDRSFENRTSFAIEVEEGLGTEDFRTLADQLFSYLPGRIKAGNADRGDLVRLLTTLADRKWQENSPVFAVAKEYLMHGLQEVEDFNTVMRFAERFPDALAPEDKDRIRTDFERCCRDYDADWTDDPDWIRSVAGDINSVGQKLGLDVKRFVDRLTERAEEVEPEHGRRPDNEEDHEDRWSEEVRASLDIDLMFEGLLHEITERSG